MACVLLSLSATGISFDFDAFLILPSVCMVISDHASGSWNIPPPFIFLMSLACDNPFASDRLAQLHYRFIDGSWKTLLERLEAVTWRGTIVGPPGSGKSILLEQLVPRLKERGFVPHLLRLTAESETAEKEAVLVQARNFRAPDFLLLVWQL